MLFSTDPRISSCELSLTVNDSDQISCEQNARYLGLNLDCNFKWNEHISRLCKTLSPKVGLLSRLRTILPSKCVELVEH